jgi:hypothetical protein
MAGFILGFPVKRNFDGLSPVTLHFQPSFLVIFCAVGSVSLLLFESELLPAFSSLSELFSLFEKTSSPSLPLYSNMRSISFSDRKCCLQAAIFTAEWD